MKNGVIAGAPGYRKIVHISRVIRGVSVFRPLFRHHRVIFIHIPKTGGQSVSQALFGKPDYIGHKRATEFEYEAPEKFRTFYKFTFVRNPHARLLSAYNYLMADSERQDDRKMRANVLGRYRNFEDFIMRGLQNDEDVRNWWHFLPQSVFLKNAAGNIGVDFIGRFENLEEDFETVRKHVGFGQKLPWLNRSRQQVSRHRDFYSERTAAIVADVYREDIAAFGYDSC